MKNSEQLQLQEEQDIPICRLNEQNELINMKDKSLNLKSRYMQSTCI